MRRCLLSSSLYSHSDVYLLSSSLNSHLVETFNRTFTATVAIVHENRGIEEPVQRLSAAQPLHVFEIY